MKWQYLMVESPASAFFGGTPDEGKVCDTFNQIGQDNWELVSIVGSSITHELTQEIVAVFKRPVEA